MTERRNIPMTVPLLGPVFEDLKQRWPHVVFGV
jgi:hypothetical protein